VVLAASIIRAMTRLHGATTQKATIFESDDVRVVEVVAMNVVFW
jgi:hypothetical protein